MRSAPTGSRARPTRTRGRAHPRPTRPPRQARSESPTAADEATAYADATAERVRAHRPRGASLLLLAEYTGQAHTRRRIRLRNERSPCPRPMTAEPGRPSVEVSSSKQGVPREHRHSLVAEPQEDRRSDLALLDRGRRVRIAQRRRQADQGAADSWPARLR